MLEVTVFCQNSGLWTGKDGWMAGWLRNTGFEKGGWRSVLEERLIGAADGAGNYGLDQQYVLGLTAKE
jgi:hypothetical protein